MGQEWNTFFLLADGFGSVWRRCLRALLKSDLKPPRRLVLCCRSRNTGSALDIGYRFGDLTLLITDIRITAASDLP